MQRLVSKAPCFVAPAHREIMRLDVRRTRHEASVAAKGDAERGRDGTRNLVLHGESVLRFAVVALGPDGQSVGDVGQLHGDAELRSAPAQMSFQDGSDV